jgi:protein-S-isoprenylcysteine O-methyltransferase Ste14
MADVITGDEPLGRDSFSKLKDIASAAPLIALYLFVIAVSLPAMRTKFAPLAVAVTPSLMLQLVLQILTLAFIVLQIGLFIFRRLPVRKAPGLLPRLAGAVGSNMGLLFLLLPSSQPGVTTLLVSNAIVAVGLAGSVSCIAFLGRSFSVLPQARGLVSSGPYRFVRHPLYLSECITTVGICCQYLQPWSVLLMLGTFAVQLVRMHYEESVLSEAYPSYRDYSARTVRLIPHVY